ncbi:hypothetical protein ES703_09440 [subsurface metagenome]
MLRIYRLPLRLITQGKWLRITHSAKAILPVLGVHADDDGICWPGMKIIRYLSGCVRPETARAGIRSLVEMDLIEKVRQGRRNVYYLKPPAITEGKSYYPMSEEFVLTGWTSLSYVEKAVFAVLAVKATIESRDDPDFPEGFAEDEEWFGAGEIQKKKWQRLAGISHRSCDKAIKGLIEKGQIVLREENRYIVCR